jgi:transcriptional regulator
MPKRRDLLLGFAAAVASHAEQQDGTIYIPEKQSEKDRPFLLDFIEEFSFAMVVTGQPSVQITNVPTILRREPGGWGKIWWHISKANAQNQALSKAPATAVFHGPHGYISPNWYPATDKPRNAVPTWNFAVVHASGPVRRIESEEELAVGLRTLVGRNESKYGGGGPWKFDDMPENYLKGMRLGIVGYEMTIEKVEGKFKLGHERSEEDREGVLRGLEKSPKERDLLALSRSYYRRSAK